MRSDPDFFLEVDGAVFGRACGMFDFKGLLQTACCSPRRERLFAVVTCHFKKSVLLVPHVGRSGMTGRSSQHSFEGFSVGDTRTESRVTSLPGTPQVTRLHRSPKFEVPGETRFIT